MKESRFCVVCAGFLLCALAGKLAISVVNGAWALYPGWGIRFVVDAAAIWIVAQSKVKAKSVGVFLGALLYVTTVVILALLDGANIIEIYTF